MSVLRTLGLHQSHALLLGLQGSSEWRVPDGGVGLWAWVTGQPLEGHRSLAGWYPEVSLLPLGTFVGQLPLATHHPLTVDPPTQSLVHLRIDGACADQVGATWSPLPRGSQSGRGAGGASPWGEVGTSVWRWEVRGRRLLQGYWRLIKGAFPRWGGGGGGEGGQTPGTALLRKGLSTPA